MRLKYHNKLDEKRLISITEENGRISLNNSQLKITYLDTENVIAFKEEEFEAILKQYFDIEI